MRVTLTLLGLLLSLACCTHHEISYHPTPGNDTTRLWPAFDTNTMLYGYINDQGTFAIDPAYRSAHTFACGAALVQLPDNTYGYINSHGELLAQGFEAAEQHYEHLAQVVQNGHIGYVNRQAELCIALPYTPTEAVVTNFSSTHTALVNHLSSPCYQFINLAGTTVLELNKEQFNFVDNFVDSLARFRSNGLYGFINLDGEVTITPQYTLAEDFNAGWAHVRKGNYSTFVNKQGKEMNAQFENARAFSANHLAPVRLNGQWGYCNTTGEIVIACTYQQAYPFSNGYAVSVVNNKFGVIDTHNHIVIPHCYDYMLSAFHNGLILAAKRTNEGNTYYYLTPQHRCIYQWSVNP